MSSSVGKLSKEEFRRQKDLEAARKAGTAPAEVDEKGNAINPHIPQFMSKAPWYLDTGKPSLKHQRKPETGYVKPDLNFGSQKVKVVEPPTTKYRKGACENCGSMTHKSKDCLERPRKKGAKWTGKDIRGDEILEDPSGAASPGEKVKHDFESKRDRWNGYDPSHHQKVMKEYEAVEEARRKLREQEIDMQTSSESTIHTAKKLARKEKKEKDKDGDANGNGNGDVDFGTDSEDDSDEDKYAEKASMVGQKMDTNKRITVRNLRIREDRAKYLYNLNPDSAYYDPKTRSMREAPQEGVRPEDAQFAGDNFTRSAGDAINMQRMQLFSWQAEARGNDLNLQANPTVNEIQFRQFQEKKEKLRESTKGSILERYGGQEHFDSVPKELLTGQTENYVEYSRTGQVIKGVEKMKPKSKYEEDVYDQNHTTIWGSWYDLSSGQWGYACCHSTIPNTYCTGRAGIEASKAGNAFDASNGKGKEKEAQMTQEKGKAREIESAASASTSNGKKRTADGKEKKDRRSRSLSFSSEEGSEASSSNSDSDSDSDSDSGSFSSSSSSSSDHRRRSRKSKSKSKSRSHSKSHSKSKKSSRSKSKKSKKSPVPDWALEAAEVTRRAEARIGKGKAGESKMEDQSEVTEEQMEEWRKKNPEKNYEDPMANYVDEEDQK